VKEAGNQGKREVKGENTKRREVERVEDRK
jgi:hypothetical protein